MADSFATELELLHLFYSVPDLKTQALADEFVAACEKRNPDIVEFLASGMLCYIECRLGGVCFCGKMFEERETCSVNADLSSILRMCERHWKEFMPQKEKKSSEQYRNECGNDDFEEDPETRFVRSKCIS